MEEIRFLLGRSLHFDLIKWRRKEDGPLKLTFSVHFEEILGIGNHRKSMYLIVPGISHRNTRDSNDVLLDYIWECERIRAIFVLFFNA